MKYPQWALEVCPELISVKNEEALKRFGNSQPRVWRIKEQTFREMQEDKIKDNSK